MSGPTPPTPASSKDELIATWGRVGVSGIIVVSFLATLVLVLTKTVAESQTTTYLVTTLGTLATMVVGFWVGSSSGSVTKSATIERQGAQMATMAPDAPPILLAPPADQRAHGKIARINNQPRKAPDGMSAADTASWLAGWDDTDKALALAAGAVTSTGTTTT
jgi:hypothetical protein